MKQPLPPNTEYLGDGLYVNESWSGTIHVFSYNGDTILDEVWMERGEILALIDFAKKKGIIK